MEDDGRAIEAFLSDRRARWRRVLATTVIVMLVTLWLDYRLTIFAIIALPFPWLMSQRVRAFERELHRVDAYELRLDDDAVIIVSSEDENVISFDEVVAVRVANDHLVVVQRTRDPHQPRHFTLPGEAEALRRVTRVLRGVGLAVVDEGLSSGLSTD